MLNANREGMRDSEKEDTINNRPPLKPPYILDADGEVIGTIEKEDLLHMVPKLKPPQNHHQNVYDRVRVSWIRQI